MRFQTAKWKRELDYALRKELWAFDGNHIAVGFQYESHDHDGQWWRSYGNELWVFDEARLMARREASINDLRHHRGRPPHLRPPPGGRPHGHPVAVGPGRMRAGFGGLAVTGLRLGVALGGKRMGRRRARG